MAIGDLLGSIGFGGGGGGIISIIWLFLGIFVTSAIIGGIFWFFWNMRKWNIKKVYFRIPRDVKYLKDSSGQIDLENSKCSIKREVGKGMYDAKRGVVFIIRKGKAKVEMKPFNLSQYLDADGALEVVQVGANRFIPVIPKSYVLYEDDVTGEVSTLINLKADNSESKAWKESFERNSKQAFSIVNLLQQYQVPIMIGLVIMLWGIQLFILYNKIK